MTRKFSTGQWTGAVLVILAVVFWYWVGLFGRLGACGIVDSKWKIQFGCWGASFFNSLTDNFSSQFRTFAGGLNMLLTWITQVILGSLPALSGGGPMVQTVAPYVFIAVMCLLAWWLQRSLRLVIGIAIGLLIVLNQGLWKPTIESLVLAVSGAATSMAIGVPIGIWAAHRPRVYNFLQPVLDMMQTLPTFVYLIPVMTLFSIGNAAGLIVTIIFVIPTAVRLTHLGMTSVPRSIVEAGEAFGATNQQLLWKVELPSARPTIMAALTQCIMLSLSMVVFAALIGAGGLGAEINKALANRDIARGLEDGMAIVIIAIVLDRLCQIGKGAK